MHGLGWTNTRKANLLVRQLGWDSSFDTLVSANKHVIKSIQKTTLRNKLHAGGDKLHIPIGNHVLLMDHPEGQNKFKDWYKSDVYIVVDSHKEEPNVYYIQPLDYTQEVKPKAVN